ncbi:single-stranded-DNA-specific exonuclease RecJ [Prochlorococcus sp. MIT 1300]|uniref:single-stranded-DNA-specific exonuclease RecJ n=1 Tax=Prochlorococcus sp. MIT 1300 TaxID=3096218 RepID=UPI002A75F693|nr:single-stranded-DNA-specific exonuclease RecJ [Prochlorococcus sp. MIT 1300]
MSQLAFSKYIPASWSVPTDVGTDPLPELTISPCLRALLSRRGFKDELEVKNFFKSKEPRDPVNDFPDLKVALERIQIACKDKEKIAICGDYDADGMTSTSLLLNSLGALGCEPIPLIPNRLDDGYGLSERMVREVASKDIKLIITVDNGVSAIEAILLARELSIEIILSDHHTIPNSLPPVLALIHPSTTPKDSPYRSLAGVGLAFIITLSLYKFVNSKVSTNSYRDLFCIGTIADMAPLIGANRYYLKKGLASINKSQCIGLRSLVEISGLDKNSIRASDIGFKLAPRINAVGRLGEPSLIIDLLTAKSEKTAYNLARECDKLNRLRRNLCEGIEAEVLALIEADREEIPSFILIAQNHWHQGVIGIVASRIMERFDRPTAILTANSKGIFQGSARAPEGFSLPDALDTCSTDLIKYGGHPAAAGFSVSPSKLASLHKGLINFSDKHYKREMNPSRSITPEVLIRLKDIDWPLWKEIEDLEPFGIGNPQPLFWASNCTVVKKKLFSSRHLSLTLKQDNHIKTAIEFNSSRTTVIADNVDIAFKINLNNWQGRSSFQLEIVDLRPHLTTSIIARGDRLYKCCLKEKNIISIINKNGEEARAKVSNHGDIGNIEYNKQGSYIRSLFIDASIALGVRL